MAFFQNLWAELVSEFTATFIAEQRYLLFLNGLKTTLIVAFGAEKLGENFRANMLESPEAREDILRALIDDAALMQTAAAEYVAVSEAEAIAFIKSAAGLQKDGKFSPELYQQFLLGQGKSDQQFVAEIQRDLSKEALVAGVAGTYPIPKAIVQQMHDILTEARFVRTMTFRATDHLDEVSVSDEEAKAYYDAHQKEFLSTEHIKAQYVVLSPENFRNVKINPEEIRNYYEQNLNRWTAPEERRASHILIDFGSDKAAALKKAEAVLAEVKADPKRFAELAKQESADTGSAEQGGDLDFFGRGIMTKPFEDAVFAAKKGDMPVDRGVARGGKDQLATVQVLVTEGPLLKTDAGLFQQRTPAAVACTGGAGKSFHV